MSANPNLLAEIDPVVFAKFGLTLRPPKSVCGKHTAPSIELSQHPTIGQLNMLFERGDQIFFMLEREGKVKHSALCELTEATNAETIEDLEKHNRDGWNIYVAMNPFPVGTTKRSQELVEVIRNIYIDADTDGAETLRKIDEAVKREIVPQPHLIVATSPNKYHVSWRVEGVTPAQAKVLLREMAAYFGGDHAATDLNRVLRLAGFKNLKRGDDGNLKYGDFVCAVRQSFDGPRHSFEDFKISANHKELVAEGTSAKAEKQSVSVESGDSTEVTSKRAILMQGTVVSRTPFRITLGSSSLDYKSNSEADQALCNLLAIEKPDAEYIDATFRESALSRDKWINRQGYRYETIKKALLGRGQVATTDASGAGGQTDGRTSFHGLKFALPQVIPDPKTGHLNFVCAPLSGQRDGLFPLGDVSVSCAPSGGGKSSLNYSMLDNQRTRENFFGHETFGRPFLILCYDRGQNAAKRTMGRLGLEGREKDFPTTYLSPMLDDANAIAQNIIEKIESAEEFPQIVYVEGGDLASTDPSKLAPTKQFLTRLQKIAEYYHIAIILSVGSPKTKIGEGYTAKRDNIFGSSVWGRMVETVAVLFYRQGDDTDSRRTLFILPRNARSERYDLIFTDGKLVIDPNPNYEEESPEEKWFESQGSRWFTANDLMKGLNVSRSTSRNMVREAHRQGIIRRKTGRPRNGEGAIAQYQWIDPDRVVSPISQPAIEVDF